MKIMKKITIQRFVPEVVYCPSCGSTSNEMESYAMEGTYAYNRYYCQDCGCVWRVLQKWDNVKVKLISTKVVNKK